MTTSKRKMARGAILVAMGALASCSRSSSRGPDPAGSAAGALTATGTPSGPGGKVARVGAATNTRDMLSGISKECLRCAEKAGCLEAATQGGVCETLPNKARPDGVNEYALCLDTLRCVFTTKCANTGEETPCLCGKADVVDCMNGKAAPEGTCVAEYKKDFGNDGKAMVDQFVNQSFGAGLANYIIQCVIPSCHMCKIP